ncbi:HSF-type DNA-binding-domain-containing protein [Phanerochaete sordida]|uniref:HSF-type DNA-binding-domain-containing protein n=1 Tax=Phanerochaete sordida TaxID=48140 RepID=A0A9P3LL19_9APHY|nr:HSF-type DNA-binding-domain-containing protein [Phanerochaete sordida]
MDQSNYRSIRQQPQNQYDPLPPPSSLGSSSNFRTNTLPPLNVSQSSIAQPSLPSTSSPSPRGYPPPTYSHPSLSTAAQLPPPLSSPMGLGGSISWNHRTSSSRDDYTGLTPPLRRVESRGSLKDDAYERLDRDRADREQQRERERERERDRDAQQERERRDHRDRERQESTDPSGSARDNVKHEGGEDGMPSTSDFVKKLYKMLEDPAFQPVVSWGPHGDCFVVKDMNEFTKSILPRMFKHSNFASFVRQLNKYDFHKVKNTDDNTYGEHSWTFRHPDFHADRRDALENIKRKVPAARKSVGGGAATRASPSPGATADLTAISSSLLNTQNQVQMLQQQIGNTSSALSTTTNQLQSTNSTMNALQSTVSTLSSTVSSLTTQISQISRMHEERLSRMQDEFVRAQEEMANHIRNLENNYQNVLNEMVLFQRNMAQQDGLMQNLIQYFLQVENGKLKAEDAANALAAPPGTAANSPAAPSPSRANGARPGSSDGAAPAPAPGLPDGNPFLPVTEAQRMMGGAYNDMDIARASLAQMSEISRRAGAAGLSFAQGAPPPDGARPDGPSMSKIFAAASTLMPELERPLSRQDALARIEELSRARPTSAQGAHAPQGGLEGLPGPPGGSPGIYTDAQDPYGALLAQGGAPDERYGVPLSSATLGHEGLQVFTVGHLMPKSSLADENGNWSFDPSALGMAPPPPPALASSSAVAALDSAVVMPTPQGMGGDPEQEGEAERQQPIVVVPDPELAPQPGPPTAATSQKLRVRRSTYVPGWAVPPRVLLVDDDAISRKLSSKFLQVFGCTIDVAVDGDVAVNKMNLEKYDLVLMDIVMPRLDGVSATSLIRQFDHMTPIISMTSNSKPDDITKYYSSGMNDVLPKPFTKDGLLEMLERHLMHLKVIQTMQKIPRSIGIPPLSDSSFDQALAAQANAIASGSAGPSNGVAAAGPSTNGFSLGDDDGKINPFAGMGLTDEQYTLILQNMVNGESFMGIGPLPGMGMSMGMMGMAMDSGKRGLDDPEDGRDGKKGRFEVIE